MALTGKFTNIHEVIERIKRDGIGQFTEEEAKEWAFEAVSLIGVPSHYIDKVATLEVEDARAMLPYDLFDITEGGIREATKKIVLRLEYDIYYDSEKVGETNVPRLFETTGESVVYVNGVQQDMQDAYLAPISFGVDNNQKYTYKINGNFIYTGFKSGTIEIAYKAFPVDNDGSPLIEDNYKVVRAVASYIKRKVAERMWMNDEISLQKKDHFVQQSMFHMSSAKSEASIGSVDNWEAIRSRTMRLRRDPNLQRIGFSGYSNREGLNI